MRNESLIAARQQSGYSQSTAAAMVGVSEDTWANWESGRRPADHEKIALFGKIVRANADPHIKLGVALSKLNALVQEIRKLAAECGAREYIDITSTPNSPAPAQPVTVPAAPIAPPPGDFHISAGSDVGKMLGLK